jgi:hypothetical protein
MAKKLNEDALKNELAGSAFFMRTKSSDSPTLPGGKSPRKGAPKTKDAKKETQLEAPTSVSGGPRTSKVHEAAKVESSPILGRPKAFYITEDQDRNLDALVAEIALRLAGRLNFKVDRSVVVRLILDTQNMTSETTIKRLSDELVSRLVSQLTG